MSNDIILACPRCKEFANVGKVGKIWDPYGFEIYGFIARHRECGPVQCGDSHSDIDTGSEGWTYAPRHEPTENPFVDAYNWLRYHWLRITHSIREIL